MKYIILQSDFKLDKMFVTSRSRGFENLVLPEDSSW
jgi:hypothetical protein